MAENPRSKFWTISPGEGIDLAVESEGIAAEKPLTVGQLFLDACQIFSDRHALRYLEEDTWIPVTFTQYYANCLNTAKSFIKLGLQKYHGVAILGFNAPEWFYSNIGAMFAGGLSVGIYATNAPEACQFIADDCKANIIVVENQKQLDKILQIRDQLPELKAIIQYRGKLSQEYKDVYDWEQFLELGKDVEDKEVEDLIKQQKPEECCLLVYTSGTTGTPKAVMLSHDNLTWTSKALFQHISIPANWHGKGPADIISYLPLSHIAGQVADIYLPLVAGCTVNFAQPDALKGSLVNTLKQVKPTMFFGVPRVWEKIMESIQAKSVTVKGIRKKVGSWAVAKGFEGNENLQNKQPYPWGWTIAGFLLNKIKLQLGLENAKTLSVGAAPMQRKVVEFFMGFDLPVLELYGMSENTGPAASNTLTDWKLGTVGKALCGTKLKLHNLDKDGEGEVCMYGRHVFMGYLNKEEKTKETIDDDGWLHSGDLGKIDEDGFLSITGRLKELIITSGGENVAPVPIESRIKDAVPFLSNVMIIGDKQKYLSCLVTIKCVVDLDTGEPKDEVHPTALPYLKEAKCELTKPSEIAEQKVEGVMKLIQEGLDKANEHTVSRAQKVQKFSLLNTDFSMPGGELGPTLKLKRRVVVDKYSAAIDALYNENAA